MQFALGQAIPFCQSQDFFPALDSFIPSFYSWHFFLLQHAIWKSDIQHLFHAFSVRFAYHGTIHKLSHALTGFFRQDMTGMAMTTQNLSRPCHFESFCSTLVCLLLHSFFSHN